MDGLVGAIRAALDAAGRDDVVIVSYAAKYASAFYGPFREAAESAPRVRRPPQLPDGPGQRARGAVARSRSTSTKAPTSSWSSRRSPYLDVIRRVKERFDVPVAAYNVSGEFAMVKAAGAAGWLDEDARRDGDPAQHPSRRRRHHPDLLREGRSRAY